MFFVLGAVMFRSVSPFHFKRTGGITLNKKYDTPLFLYVGVTKVVKESSMSVASRGNDGMYNLRENRYQKYSQKLRE